MYDILAMLSLAFASLSPRSPSVHPRTAISDPRWTKGVKWQIEIQGGLDQKASLVPTDAVVWDVDLFQANTTGMIKKYLKPANRIVLCYFSVGTIHDSADHKDPDLAKFDGVKRGAGYRHYPEEKWIDITDPKVIQIMTERIQLAASIGCDGIDPDNIDGYKIDREFNPPAPQNGINLVQSDYQKYVDSLLAAAKAANVMMGQKNAPELTNATVGKADFAVLEECLTPDPSEPNDVCDSWQPYAKAGKPVFQIEYPKSVQPCDAPKLDINPGDCPAPVCPSKAVDKDEFKYYCGPGSNKTGNDQGYSLIIKQDGNACGLGNYTEYCDSNQPIFVHLDEENDS